MSEPALEEVLDFALELSREVGRFILPLWKHVIVKHKPDGSEVTEADRGAEQLLRQRIAERYPDHAVLGEEYGGDPVRDAEHLWIIDPIDGTASFAVGLPLFGTLIAYLNHGQPCVGVVAAHALAETTYAATGRGCWHQSNDAGPKQVHTSTVTDLADALVASTSIEHTDLDPRHPNASFCLSQLYRQARRFRWSGDCINYALLCQGRVDVAMDPRMNPWDIAALAPCIREAGGVLSSVDGNPDVVWNSTLVASANPGLHRKVLESLRPA
jgi:histidinol-phosphatase